MDAAFARETVMRAWLRAEAKCECKRMMHGHSGRCNKALIWGNRGRDAWGSWEAHARDNRSDTALSNCEILCRDCHIHSFGALPNHSTNRQTAAHRLY